MEPDQVESFLDRYEHCSIWLVSPAKGIGHVPDRIPNFFILANFSLYMMEGVDLPSCSKPLIVNVQSAIVGISGLLNGMCCMEMTLILNRSKSDHDLPPIAAI